MENNKILAIHDICCIDDIGRVVWLECYFDGHTSLQPYMYDIDFTQKPIMINGRDYFYNLDEVNVKEHIENLFGTNWQDKRYCWWNKRPDDKERFENDEWEYV